MSYCIYLRKSRPDIDAEKHGEGETLARHQSMLMELAKKCKLDVVKVYKEIVSGDSISARPQMQALLSDIGQGKYEGVLVAEVERLARGNTIDQGIVAQAFKESGTKIITPVKTYDPNNEIDEEFFEFSLFMSRREYKTIRRRLEAGRLSAVKEGNYIGTNAPYGYRKTSPDPKTHTLEIIPEEAETVRLIYKLYLDGHGSKYIASELNRMGIKPQKSENWEYPSIKKILANPVYCGKIGWKTKSNGDILYQGLHEPVIDENTFNAVQEKRKSNPVAQIHPNDRLLNYYHGILYCSNCGHQLKRRCISSTGKDYLLCVYRECRGKTVCASMKDVDESVIASFRYRIENLKKIMESESGEEKKSIPDVKTPLVSELEKSKKQLSRLYDLLEQDIYDVNTFLERSETVKSRISSLESAIKEIDDETKPRLSPQESILRLQYVVDNFYTSSPEEKNRLLHSVVRKIYYSKTVRMCRRNRSSDLSLQADFL
jgi:DNA invertase Pin-like site-specific DNA recombinase